MLEEAQETKKTKANIDNLVGIMTSIYKDKANESVFQSVAKINQNLLDREALSTMSPGTREKYTKSLIAERKRLIDQMSGVQQEKKKD